MRAPATRTIHISSGRSAFIPAAPACRSGDSCPVEKPLRREPAYTIRGCVITPGSAARFYGRTVIFDGAGGLTDSILYGSGVLRLPPAATRHPVEPEIVISFESLASCQLVFMALEGLRERRKDPLLGIVENNLCEVLRISADHSGHSGHGSRRARVSRLQIERGYDDHSDDWVEKIANLDALETDIIAAALSRAGGVMIPLDAQRAQRLYRSLTGNRRDRHRLGLSIRCGRCGQMSIWDGYKTYTDPPEYVCRRCVGRSSPRGSLKSGMSRARP